jgi:hypothetical protein
MMRLQNHSDLRRRINLALAGLLTDDEMRALDSQLREDDAAIELFINYCQLEVDLYLHAKSIPDRRAVHNAA